MSKKIAVTGGSGKLGGACVDALLVEGWTPFNFERFSNVMDPADYAEFPSFESDPASRKWNLWSYIDARDGAQAAAKALAYDEPGFEAFVIAADDTVMSTPSAELMAEFFPDVEFRAEVPGTAALCSLEKARRLLGWTPRHHWRDHVDAP